MKKFLQNTLILSLLVTCLYALIFLLIPTGKIGDVYPRITSPQQTSLILGTSRAAQGIDPDIINEKLKNRYPQLAIYNFSFHIDETTYNPHYYAAIQKKLTPSSPHKGLFILTVDPWQFKNELNILGELDLKSVSSNPNLEYLWKFFDRTWISPLPTHLTINPSGRSIVSYTMKSQEAWNRRMQVYRDMATTYQYSKASEDVFLKLIQFLQRRGDVYLVRMPVSAEMAALEHSVMPNFSDHINTIAHEKNVHYFDFIHDSFATTDGNHLTKTEGDRFSTLLSDSILHHAI